MAQLCETCHGTLDMHYGLWCPMCDKPTPIKEPVLDFFKVAKYIAAHEGYSWQQLNGERNWYQHLLLEIEFPGNDSYIPWTIDDSEEELVTQFNAGLIKHFGFKQDDNLILWISW